MSFQKSHIILGLIIICSISLVFKLYTVDFSIPVYSDNLDYTLYAIAHTNGDFSQSSHRGIGWSLFVFPFFKLINSNDFLVYSSIIRILSLSIATISVVIIYFLGRKFFNEKYSLVVASLFAFEPHLNYNAGFGLSEPLYHLAIIASFYFILNKNSKYIIPSLILAGAAWWIRINGLSIFIIITTIYFITLRKSPRLFRNYFIGFTLFLILMSPMLLQRYEQFGDPLYTDYNSMIFAGSFEKILGENTRNVNPTALDYIEKNGLYSFFENFIFKGVYNVLWLLSRISFPYMLVLIPFGMIFSLRAFDQDSKYIRSNWVFILLSLAFLIVTISNVPERRYLFYIFPFLIIFGTIPIQRLTEYGLSTFSFTKKQKNLFLVIVILIIVILSGYFTTVRFGKPDIVLENEKMEFAKFAINNLHGKTLRDFGSAMDYIFYQIMTDTPGEFKTYKINADIKQYQTSNAQDETFNTIFIYGESLQDIITNGKEHGLRFIISYDKSQFLYPFLDEIYHKEENYPYLVKVFDANEYGFNRLKIKVFEIDYNKFDEFINSKENILNKG